MITVLSAVGAALAALGSLAAVIVSYILLRRATDPDVLVYTTQDDVEPRFLYIVIENIGRAVAYNIDFNLSAKLQHEIVWFPRELTGAFTAGIPALPPGGKRRYIWGDFDSVMKQLGGRRVVCDVSFEGQHYFTRFSTHFRNTCILEAESYRDSIDHLPNPHSKLIDEIKRLRETLAAFATLKKDLSEIGSRLRDLRR